MGLLIICVQPEGIQFLILTVGQTIWQLNVFMSLLLYGLLMLFNVALFRSDDVDDDDDAVKSCSMFLLRYTHICIMPKQSLIHLI